MSHNHLNSSIRDTIAKYCNLSQQEIAKITGYHQSTISRELKRGIHQGHYCPTHAQADADSKKQIRRKPKEMNKASRKLYAEFIKKYLSEHLSLEYASRDWLIEHPEDTVPVLNTLYQWVYDSGLGMSLVRKRKTRKKHKSPTKAGPLGNDYKSIEDRLPRIELGLELGHWEGDLVVGKGHKGALVVLSEISSRFTRIQRIETKSTWETNKAVCRLLEELNAKTLTWDQGSEMSSYQDLEKQLGIQIYFCHPHAPWEKPLVENTNGWIRRPFDKETNFLKVSNKEVQEVEDWLNNRRMPVLLGRTPRESMHL